MASTQQPRGGKRRRPPGKTASRLFSNSSSASVLPLLDLARASNTVFPPAPRSYRPPRQKPEWVSALPSGGLFHAGLVEVDKERRLQELSLRLSRLETERQMEASSLLPLNRSAYSFLSAHTHFPKSKELMKTSGSGVHQWPTRRIDGEPGATVPTREQREALEQEAFDTYRAQFDDQQQQQQQQQGAEGEGMEGEGGQLPPVQDAGPPPQTPSDGLEFTAVALLRRFLRNTDQNGRLPAHVVSAADRHLSQLEDALLNRIGRRMVPSREAESQEGLDGVSPTPPAEPRTGNPRNTGRGGKATEAGQGDGEGAADGGEPSGPWQGHGDERDVQTLRSPPSHGNAESPGGKLRRTRSVSKQDISRALEAKGQKGSTLGALLAIKSEEQESDEDEESMGDDMVEFVPEADEDASKRPGSRAMHIEGEAFVFERAGVRVTIDGIEALPDGIALPSHRTTYEALDLSNLEYVRPLTETNSEWVVVDKSTSKQYTLKYCPIQGKEQREDLTTSLVASWEFCRRCPNFVQPVDAFLDSSHLRVVTLSEHSEHGSIASLLRKRGPLPEPVIVAVIKQTLVGLEFIHGRNRVCSSLCCDNILVSDRGEVKLDNLSRALKLTAPDIQRLFTHNECFSSPETLLGLEIGPPSDIWALGLAVIEMATNEPTYRPEQCPSILDFKAMVVEGQLGNDKIVGPSARKDIYSEELRQFCTDCLARFPRKRPSIRELSHSPLVRKHDSVGPDTLLAWVLGVTEAEIAKARESDDDAPIGTTVMEPAAPAQTLGAAAPPPRA